MSYRQPNTRVAFFNPTGEIISGISEARKGIADRFKTVEDFENAASIRYQELQDSLNETETMEDTDALNLLQDQISKELDELYRLDIQTFEGDRSAYNKKKSEIEKIIGTIPGLMSIIDDEGEKLKEAQNSGNFTKQLLRSNNEDYYNFVQDASSGGKNISFRIQNGNIIAQLNGKDVFNGNAFIKAKKDGLDLVNYAGDYSAEIDETIKQNAVGLQNLVSTEVIEKMKNGRTLSTREIKDFERAKEIFEQRLRESPNLGALVNESTYQLFTGYGLDEDSDNMDAWTGDDMQKAATKEALIKYMIDRQFPEDKFQVSYKEKYIKPNKVDKDKDRKDKVDYSEWITQNLRGKKQIQTISGVEANRATGLGTPGGTLKLEEISELTVPQVYKVFYDKLVSVNPRYVYGSQVDQTGENANKVFKRVGNTLIPFSVTEQQLMDDEYLNNLLVSESIL